jgi:ATP-binding cassette subfamily C (CFTR/MRP) protein 1
MTFNFIISRFLISFVENKEELWKGYLYAGLMFTTASVQTLVLAQYFNRMLFIGLRIRTALISAIYRKVRIFCNSYNTITSWSRISTHLAT